VSSITIHIFVSSTWLDLRPERQAMEAALQRVRETRFVGMEYFGSRDETTRQTSLDEVDRSRVYIGIIAGRHGSGITEDEYRRARELNLPCFLYFKRDSDIRPEWRDPEPEKAAKLAAFRQELQRNHIIAEFDSPSDLAARVTADLHNWLVKEYLTPRLADVAQKRTPREQARELLAAIKDESGLDADLLAAARKAAPLPPLVTLAISAAALIAAGAIGAYFYSTRNDGVYHVRAVVFNEKGAPEEEAEVQSIPGGARKKLAIGWEFDIPPSTRPLDGKLTIFAEKKSAFLKGQADLTLDKDFNPTVTIRMTRDTSAKVRGQVIDERGRAVAGASVSVVGFDNEGVITKEGGNFELPAHAAENQLVQLFAEKDGVGTARLWHPAGREPAPLVLSKE
jgi:hypothetical protein